MNMNSSIIETPRLRVRSWTDEDLPFFIALNQGPEVMRYYPSCLSAEQSTHLFNKIREHFRVEGFGFYALERKDTQLTFGMLGLQRVSTELPFAPAVEIGWRLASDQWKQGFATEAAQAVLDYGTRELELNNILSFTSKPNVPSQRVMEKIGLTHCPKEDFNHPALEAGSPLKPHLLYRYLQRT